MLDAVQAESHYKHLNWDLLLKKQQVQLLPYFLLQYTSVEFIDFAISESIGGGISIHYCYLWTNYLWRYLVWLGSKLQILISGYTGVLIDGYFKDSYLKIVLSMVSIIN